MWAVSVEPPSSWKTWTSARAGPVLVRVRSSRPAFCGVAPRMTSAGPLPAGSRARCGWYPPAGGRVVRGAAQDLMRSRIQTPAGFSEPVPAQGPLFAQVPGVKTAPERWSSEKFQLTQLIRFRAMRSR